MSFIDELKRRNVFKVGTAYVIVAWLLLQVASVILPTFRTPDWVMQAFTVLLFLGFPLALILAWAFELTPEGIKRDEDVVRSGSIARLTSRKLDYFIIAALSLALVFVVIDQYVLEEEAAPSALTDPADLSVAIDAVSTVPERSIAVLPFRNRSAVAEDAYFVDGIHDDILTQLSKLYLEFAFETPRSLREYIQNQTGAIEDTTLQFAFEIALLAGT